MSKGDFDTVDVMLRLAKTIFEGGTVTSAWIEKQFSVSRSTAKRYMTRLECSLPVVSVGQANGSLRCGRRALRLMKPARALR